MLKHQTMFIFLMTLASFWLASPSHSLDYETEPVTYLDQNWSPQVRQAFYTSPQGSHLIPLNFALALKDPQSGANFFTSDFLKRYGFIAQKPDAKRNPLGLPVGLAIDGYIGRSVFWTYRSGPRQIGMACAACHTNNLNYNGKTLRIDGGQGLLNFQSFMAAMDTALFDVAENKAKLNRFLSRAQKVSDFPQSLRQIRASFDSFLNERREWRRMNSSTTTYGFGRTDAFGVIYNQVLAQALRIPANATEPDAPVNYPVLWDTPQHDFVQWTGLASNSLENSGPLARNIGQVLGVFGHVDIFQQTDTLHGYCSSARRTKLSALDKMTRDLVSPKWPEEVLGQIDHNKAGRGQALYTQRCLSCHAVLSDTRSPDRKVKALLIPSSFLGVDPKLGINSARIAQAGPLRGRLTRLTYGRALDEFEPASVLLGHVVNGAVAGSLSVTTCQNKMDTSLRDLEEQWPIFMQRIANPPPLEPLDRLPANTRNALIRRGLTRLKARPLNGIWASPPFLHNGSVKNIYELLLPANERSARFMLGCTSYDPAKLGYECGSPDAVSDKLSLLDTAVSGSHNTGHEYGLGLSEAERYDLVEYLKTL